MKPHNSDLVSQKIYLKDASLEAPLGATAFAKDWQPEINVDINTKNSKVSDDNFEVVLTMTVTATLGKADRFIDRGAAGGSIFGSGTTGITFESGFRYYGPESLFPYIREAIDSLTIKGFRH